MADRPTFNDSPTRAPKPARRMMWQVFIGFDTSDDPSAPVDEETHEYLVEAPHMKDAIEKALLELSKSGATVHSVHALSVKLLPPVLV